MRIQRLNMDNTWFLEFDGLKLLIDPWLEGTEIDFFPWFNTQWHRTKPMDYTDLPAFDAVLITQKYPDHYHKQTLLKIKPALVIVPKSIEQSIRKLLPASKVFVLDKKQPIFEKNGVKISFYPTSRKIDPIYDAFLISDSQESVFVASHGYFMSEAAATLSAPVKLLICPFNEFQLPFYLGGTISPGLKGILHLNERLNPACIVATHDEDKHAKGIVIKTAKITRNSVAELRKMGQFKGKILEINDYKPITI